MELIAGGADPMALLQGGTAGGKAGGGGDILMAELRLGPNMLLEAARAGNLDGVRHALRGGHWQTFDPNTRDREHGRTPLIAAVVHGHAAAVAELSCQAVVQLDLVDDVGPPCQLAPPRALAGVRVFSMATLYVSWACMCRGAWARITMDQLRHWAL
jgi:hypothetical protein